MNFSDSFMAYDAKEGAFKIICPPNDMRFLHCIGEVFQLCVDKWHITFEQLAYLIGKYDLIKYCYNSYLILCHEGADEMVNAIEECIKYVDKHGSLNLTWDVNSIGKKKNSKVKVQKEKNKNKGIC